MSKYLEEGDFRRLKRAMESYFCGNSPTKTGMHEVYAENNCFLATRGTLRLC
jgi:hypothetical protein